MTRDISHFALTLILATLGLYLTCCTSKEQENKPSKAQIMDNTPKPHKYYSRTDTTKLNVSDTEWKTLLPHDLYEVARNKDTEAPFTGKYWNATGLGIYYCAVCGNMLFRSDTKFASSCGWPSFYETVRPTSVIYENDTSYNMKRTEVLCGRCNSHLGHIFDDGPPPTHKRFCMNSIILEFVPDSTANAPKTH